MVRERGVNIHMHKHKDIAIIRPNLLSVVSSRDEMYSAELCVQITGQDYRRGFK